MTDKVTPSRRSILKAMSAGVAASCLAPWSEARAAFRARLGAMAIQDDFANAAGLYSLADGVTYFNHASVGTMPRAVQEARRAYLDAVETNPWLYMWGPAWVGQIEETRRTVAGFIGVNPEELAITHNTTEGFNTLAHGLPLGQGDEVLFSSMNHAGASICWRHTSSGLGFSVRQFEFPVERAATMTPDEIVARYVEQIRPETRVLCFPHIDNMVGLRYPVQKLASEARANGVEFIAVDGAQAIGMIPVNVGELGVDFYATSAHKWLQSPKGLGLLYVRKDIQARLKPMWVTWGQTRWAGTARIYEDYGTRNRAELLTLADCVAFLKKLGMKSRDEHFRYLHDYFRTTVEQTDGLTWRSPQAWEDGCSLFAIEVDGHPAGEVSDLMYQKHGYVMRAFPAENLNTLRISLNVMNTPAQIDGFVQVVKDEVLA